MFVRLFFASMVFLPFGILAQVQKALEPVHQSVVRCTVKDEEFDLTMRVVTIFLHSDEFQSARGHFTLAQIGQASEYTYRAVISEDSGQALGIFPENKQVTIEYTSEGPKYIKEIRASLSFRDSKKWDLVVNGATGEGVFSVPVLDADDNVEYLEEEQADCELDGKASVFASFIER